MCICLCTQRPPSLPSRKGSDILLNRMAKENEMIRNFAIDCCYFCFCDLVSSDSIQTIELKYAGSLNLIYMPIKENEKFYMGVAGGRQNRANKLHGSLVQKQSVLRCQKNRCNQVNFVSTAQSTPSCSIPNLLPETDVHKASRSSRFFL